ncbi:MAG: hypothetical protein JNK85_28925 [Verrucomicrobiales bacterium]|nr:hypothetical protein [Verrucomicrobiales bacterium]
MPDTLKLKSKVQALQLNTEGLLKLLGGGSDDRLRFWEILKGITTPAEFRLVAHQLDAMQGLVKQVQASAKVIEQTAAKIGK